MVMGAVASHAIQGIAVKILVIDDCPGLVDALDAGFRLQWPQCQVAVAESGDRALELFPQENPDIVLLEVLVPGMGGFEVLRHIRQISDVPMVVVTTKAEELDKIRALELGADDFVTKPFSFQELIGRMKAVLRRAGSAPLDVCRPHISCGDLLIDHASRSVSIRGRPVRLGPTEYRLLSALAQAPNQILSQQALAARVWARQGGEQSGIRVYIKRLRDKIEDVPSQPRYILTEGSRGYKLAVPDVARAARVKL